MNPNRQVLLKDAMRKVTKYIHASGIFGKKNKNLISSTTRGRRKAVKATTSQATTGK